VPTLVLGLIFIVFFGNQIRSGDQGHEARFIGLLAWRLFFSGYRPGVNIILVVGGGGGGGKGDLYRGGMMANPFSGSSKACKASIISQMALHSVDVVIGGPQMIRVALRPSADTTASVFL